MIPSVNIKFHTKVEWNIKLIKRYKNKKMSETCLNKEKSKQLTLFVVWFFFGFFGS